MSARPTNQLPSFSLVINQAAFSNVYITATWQFITTHDPQTTNTSPPTVAVATATTVSAPQVVVPVNPSPVRRIGSIIRRAVQGLGTRLRAALDT